MKLLPRKSIQRFILSIIIFSVFEYTVMSVIECPEIITKDNCVKTKIKKCCMSTGVIIKSAVKNFCKCEMNESHSSKDWNHETNNTTVTNPASTSFSTEQNCSEDYNGRKFFFDTRDNRTRTIPIYLTINSFLI